MRVNWRAFFCVCKFLRVKVKNLQKLCQTYSPMAKAASLLLFLLLLPLRLSGSYGHRVSNPPPKFISLCSCIFLHCTWVASVIQRFIMPLQCREKSRSESRHGYRGRAIDPFSMPWVASYYLLLLSTSLERIGMYQTWDMARDNPQPPLH